MSLFSFGNREMSKLTQAPIRKMVAFGMIRVQQTVREPQEARPTLGQVNVLGMMIIEDHLALPETSIPADPSI